MSEEILLITAYKDINRVGWSHFRRTNKEYFTYFLNLALNLKKYNLVVYLEDDIRKQLDHITFPPNIIFRNLATVSTFYDKYLEEDRKITSSEKYKSKIPMVRRVHPEHIYSEYNLITNSKINFMHAASKEFPEYKYYSWIDFGYVRSPSSLPRGIINTDKLPKDKITFQITNPIENIHYIHPDDMLASYTIYFAGWGFTVPASMVENFQKLWEDKLNDLRSQYVSDDDQNIVLQVYFGHPEIFNLIYNDKDFNYYNLLV